MIFSDKNLVINPSYDELRELAKKEEKTTKYGSPGYVSKIRNRSAKFTKDSKTAEFTSEDKTAIEESLKIMKNQKLIRLDKCIGEKKQYTCRLFIPTKYARIALIWSEMLLNPKEKVTEPDFVTFYCPEFKETKILIDADAFTTYVMGTDYTGETKKSFLRMWMYKLKKEGGLGLHAGSKQLELNEGKVCQLYFGLSATGKSTLTGHGLFLEGNERAWLVQDDVVGLFDNASVIGTENKGLYVKTDKLTKEEQPEIYKGVVSKKAVLENVFIKEDGEIDFFDGSLTTNGRATIQRSDMANASKHIDSDCINQIYFITRNDLMPPISKLTKEQAVLAFMLGESVESSAGDPEKAGQAVRVVGTNPFIIGDKGEEGNIFLNLLSKGDIECFILNTGGVGTVGKSFKDVKVKDTVEILLKTSRKQFKWKKPDHMNIEIPEEHIGSEFDPLYHFKNLYSEKSEKQTKERLEYLNQFKSLDKKLLDQIY